MEQCSYQCKQETDFKQMLLFQGKVLESLKNIEKDLSELKLTGNSETKDIWNAINSIRDDIKSLYWKIGFISGGASLIISVAIRMVN